MHLARPAPREPRSVRRPLSCAPGSELAEPPAALGRLLNVGGCRPDAGHDRRLALAAAVAGQLLTNRRTNASALSATSRQPLSTISPCPRPGIFSISVTPALSCCCL